MTHARLVTLLLVAGLAQLVVVAAGACVPWILGWREQAGRLRPLMRQVFWTYGAYILGSNLAFALASLTLPAALLDGSPLATCVTGFVLLWWFARLVLQFTCYDRHDAPPGWVTRCGEVVVVGAFVVLVLAYGLAFVANLGGGAA